MKTSMEDSFRLDGQQKTIYILTNIFTHAFTIVLYTIKLAKKALPVTSILNRSLGAVFCFAAYFLLSFQRVTAKRIHLEQFGFFVSFCIWAVIK